MRQIQRVAWIGGPSRGGVGGMCYLFLRELTKMGIGLDVYATDRLEGFPDLKAAFSGGENRFFSFPYEWNWNAWYGRSQKVAFGVSFIKRLPTYVRIVDAVLSEHRQKPYDAVIQFSQGELFKLGTHAGEVPIVLYPCVHAAGEHFWCRNEREIAQRCEPWWWRIMRDRYLGYRSYLQQRDYRRARGVIGMSRRFNRWVERDYKLSPERLGVVYHPIESDIESESGGQERTGDRIRLLFVGRISVRKGVELLVRAIPRVLAEYRDVEVSIVGGGSLWSNYEPLLRDLPSERCRWLRAMSNSDVHAEMRRSDVLLVPSYYEPGGIVVGEALANGMAVVASDEVGSAENLPASVCKEFRAGDDDGFHRAIALALHEVRCRREALREDAMRVAREQFDPAGMTQRLLVETERLLAGQ